MISSSLILKVRKLLDSEGFNHFISRHEELEMQSQVLAKSATNTCYLQIKFSYLIVKENSLIPLKSTSPLMSSSKTSTTRFTRGFSLSSGTDKNSLTLTDPERSFKIKRIRLDLVRNSLEFIFG
jgi:hypothetical protein